MPSASDLEQTPDQISAADAPTAVASVSRFRFDGLLPLLLVAATVIAYVPALRAGYVWDDDLHLLNNPVLKPGGLANTWIPGTYINYWPLTFTTYWVENTLWGVAHPIGFHLVNILLHALCALLVWRVLLSVDGQTSEKEPAHNGGERVVDVPDPTKNRAALLAAAIFALHPVNVESVAWVAQLKNNLSLFLTLSALWFFLRHERTRQWWIYILAVAAFGFSTLAKGMGVTLPAILLALAWWQRGTINRRDVVRVLPFLLIGVVMAGVEVAMQKEGQLWEIPRTDGSLARLAGAGWCVWFYLYKLIWPFNLSFVYPRWTIDGGKLLSFWPDASLIATIAVAWWQRRSWGRGLFMVLICYVALLLPVLGFTNIYFMRYSLVADHWQYAAMIVPVAGASTALVASSRRGRWRIAGPAAALVVLGFLATLTYRQAGVYNDMETLWRDVLMHNPESWMAHHNLGSWLADQGRTREAVQQYEAAVRFKSDDFQSYNNLGVALAQLGRLEDAVADFEQAIAINSNYDVARQNVIPQYKFLGKLLLNERRDYETARKYFIRATELAPNDADVRYGLAVALTGMNDVRGAVDALDVAVRLEPRFVQAHDMLARLLATRAPGDGGDPDRAIKEAVRACVLTRYSDSLRLDTLAISYASAGRFAEAVATEEQAMQFVAESRSPDVADVLRAHLSLFRALKPYRGPLLPVS